MREYNQKNLFASLVSSLLVFTLIYLLKYFCIHLEYITVEIIFLEDIVVNFKSHVNYIIGSLGVILRFLFHPLFEEIFNGKSEFVKLPLSEKPADLKPKNSPLVDKGYLLTDRGEGTSKNPNIGKGRSSPINYKDYEWSSGYSSSSSSSSSSNEYTNKLKADYVPFTPGNRLVRQNSTEFYDGILSRATNSEIEERIEELERSLGLYKQSVGVPAAKTEIEKIEQRLNKCRAKLHENLETLPKEQDQNPLSKGKELEGKGKEPLYKGKEPEGKGKEPEYKRRKK